MTSARDVGNIVPILLKIIPKDQIELIEELTEYVNNLWNKAPEIRRSTECWYPLGNILSRHVVILDTEWKNALFNEFMGITGSHANIE